MLSRRGFIAGLIAMPTIVRVGSLDYVPRGLLLLPVERQFNAFKVDGVSLLVRHASRRGAPPPHLADGWSEWKEIG